MTLRSILAGSLLLCLAGCAGNTIKATYATSNPDIQIGGPRPSDAPPAVTNAGSFCLEVSEKWHQDGKTPDGVALWARDTFRRVVPCV